MKYLFLFVLKGFKVEFHSEGLGVWVIISKGDVKKSFLCSHYKHAKECLRSWWYNWME